MGFDRRLFGCCLAVAALSGGRAAGQCELVELGATDAGQGKQLGISVSIDGDTALLGAIGDKDLGTNAGAAYVFERDASGWTESDKLLALDGAPSDSFGRAVALAGDTAVVGAFQDDDAGPNTGAAYVYERFAFGWAQTQKLTAEDASGGDRFGRAVAIDGDTIVVGAFRENSQGSSSGAAYVFERTATGWLQTAKLLADDGLPADQFGFAVALAGDVALIGAPLADVAGTSSGAAYAFERGASGWTQVQKLLPDDATGGDQFGYALDVDADGVVVASPFDDDLGTNSGSAYVFEAPEGSWMQADKLIAPDGFAFDVFGSAVAIEGERVVVGAPMDDDAGSRSGSAHVFERDATGWPHAKKLVALEAAAGDEYGFAVSLSGPRGVVGAWLGDLDSGENNAGSAHVLVMDEAFAAELSATPATVSLSAGGEQVLELRSCPAHAGELYLVLGSASGAAPGVLLGDVLLPLNPDDYTNAMLKDVGADPLPDPIGFLDQTGSATATFRMGEGSDPSLAGTTVHHAALVFRDAGPFLLPLTASGAASVQLVP